MEGTHPIVDFLAILIERRRICQRRIQAVEVPVLTTVITSDNSALGTVGFGALRGLVATEASD